MLHFLILLIGTNSKIHSQASLAAENKIEDIVVKTKGGEQKVYTVLRDEINDNQFYVVPSNIKVGTKDINGQQIPDLTLLLYEHKDDSGKIKQGGVLQGTMTMYPEPEIIDEIKRQVLEKVKKIELSKSPHLRKNIKAIRLSSIPLENCEFTIMTDKGLFLGNPETKTAFQGPLIATQRMGFSLSLNALGASVISALASGKGGIVVQVKIKYRGLTPPCGYTINGTWDNVYKYYEEQTKKEGGLNFWKFKFGGSKTKSKISESLTQMNGVEIRRIKCGTNDNTLEDQHLQRLKDKIENQVMSKEYKGLEKQLHELQSMFASTKDEDLKKKLIDRIADTEKLLQIGYQNSVKSVNKRKRGKISYDFSTQYLEKRESVFFGTIGFAKFNMDAETLKKKGHIIDINANDAFPYVGIALPEINPDFDLSALALDISYENSDGKVHSEAGRWVASKGWTNIRGDKIAYLRFNLIGEKDIEKRNRPEFKVKLQVISKTLNGSFTIERKFKLESGDKNLNALELLTKQFKFDGELLEYQRITGNAADLVDVNITFENSGIKISKSLRPYRSNGIYGPPKPLYILIPNNDEPIAGKVTFVTREKKIKLEPEFDNAEITLYNQDWQLSSNE
nr:hypothetical protein [Allomuricauda sp.]